MTMLKSSNLCGLQTGIKWYPNNGPLYFGLEDHLSAGYNVYNWPGVGEYHLLKTLNIISPFIGINFLRKQKLNFGFNIKLNYFYYHVQLKSDNELIKSYIPEKYSSHYFGTGFSFFATYKINKMMAFYFDISSFSSIYIDNSVFLNETIYFQQDLSKLYYGVGLSFKMIGGKRKRNHESTKN